MCEGDDCADCVDDEEDGHKGWNECLRQIRQPRHASCESAPKYVVHTVLFSKEVPARQEAHEEEEVEEEFGLGIPGFVDEVAERDDETQVGRKERRELPREDHGQRQK